METGITAEAAMPCGKPLLSRVVTKVTDDATRRNAFLKSVASAGAVAGVKYGGVVSKIVSL